MRTDWLPADWPAPHGITAGTTLKGAADFAFPAAPRFLKQVHGTRVVHVDADLFAGGPPEADASVGDRPDAICVVRTADCLPVLLCSADGRAIGAAHAGWRGLAAGVVEATVSAMAAAPADLMAWLGPAISQPAFEVGAEVREAFVAVDPAAAAAFVQNARGRWQADLYLLARQRLAAAGVTRVSGGGLCTHADPDRFYSFRRDGETGRLVSFVHRAA